MRIKNIAVCAAAAIAVLLAACLGAPRSAFAASSGEQVMYRLYNSYTGEHLYTGSVEERDTLALVGWTYEGECWVAPVSSDTPVYRLYNPYVEGGDHHYTVSVVERDYLISQGWSYEGVGWYSDDAQTCEVYREYNPNASTGTHNYTGSAEEHYSVVNTSGWNNEDVAWYALEIRSMTVEIVATDRTSHAIMGTSYTNVGQMAAYYYSMGHSYPSWAYADKGAGSIEVFAQIVMEEAAAEGVRAEVVFCQSMRETGWLQYGAQVSVWQCNFAGIGATNGGAAGASFDTVREGVRAQVQHLKAYASTAALNNECIDPRFGLIERGVATSLEDLDGRWAVPGNGYGEGIYNMIQTMFQY